MKILVTGSTGFIGRYLVKELVKEKYKVRCLLREKSDISKLPKNIEIWIGDIKNKKSLEGICKGIDVVIHLAAKTTINDISPKKYKDFYETNVLGTRFILEESVKSKVKYFIYFSTVSVFGLLKDRENLDKNIINPQTPYEKTKYEAEKICVKYSKKFKLPLLILRPTMVYDFDEPQGEFKTLVKFIKFGIVPVIGTGNNLINIIDRKFLVKTTIHFIKHRVKGIKILNEKTITLNQFLDMIAQHYSKRSYKKFFIPIKFLYPIIFLLEIFSKTLEITPIITRYRLKNIEISSL
jgi:nucleoside-diphosphate-sugar epimerase